MTVQRTWRRLLATGTAALLAASGLALAPVAANAAPGDVANATLDWGVKESFRKYIAGPIAKGTISMKGSTTTAANGSYHWSAGSGTAAVDGATANTSFGAGNGVLFQGHETDGVFVLESEFTNPRVVVDGLTAELYLDVKSKRQGGAAPVVEDNVHFADLTLSAPVVSDGSYSWLNAPAKLTADGSLAFDELYEAGDELDPVSFTLPIEQNRVWAPAVNVTMQDGTPVGSGPVYKGDVISIAGTGFDPEANVGGRGMPIPNTLPQGTYVVFGNFLENWRPSAGAPSSARKAGPQGWVLTESTVNQVPPQFAETVRKQWVPLAEDGSFTAALTLDTPAALDGGRYGIYTYGAGGVNNAAQELAVPLEYVAKYRSTTSLSVSSTGSVAPGAKVTLDASITSTTDVDGTVTFLDAGKPLGEPVEVVDGSASYSDTKLAVGTHSFSAVFTPSNEAEVASSTSATSKLNVVAKTTTSVKFSASSFAYNSARTATVTVKATGTTAKPTGKAAVTIDGKTYNANIVAGKGSIKLSKPVRAGTRAISAKYTSNATTKFASSNGKGSVKITRAIPSVSFKLDKKTVTTKQNAKFKVTVKVPGTLKATASKVKVEVYAGSKKLKTATLNSAGRVNVTLPKMKAGTHKIKVKALGNSNIAAKSSAVQTLKVKK